MKRETEFSFEELPLIIQNGYEAGLVNGVAHLTFDSEGFWNIEAISLDGYRTAPTDKDGKPLPNMKQTYLDQGTSIYLAIYDRLENEWSEKVGKHVYDAIGEDRVCAAEYRADARRDEMRERA